MARSSHTEGKSSRSSGGETAAFLCRLEEVGESGKEVAPGTVSRLVIRRAGGVYAYVCPHASAPLTWGHDQFLHPDGDLLQCRFHGALFRSEDGLCVWGPCMGNGCAASPSGTAP